MMKQKSWDQLEDESLLLSMRESVHRENKALASFLQGLLRVEERALHLHMGYPNLFEFCRHEFGLSEGSIYRRLQVARKLRSYPELATAIGDGSLNLTLASLLCPYLEHKPWAELLELVRGKSKREAIRRLVDSFAAHSSSEATASRARISYTGRETYSYRLQVPAALHHELERVREVLSHQLPHGDIMDVLASLTRTYLQRFDPQQQKRPAEDFWQTYQSQNRYIPQGLRRKLLDQADYRCQYQSPEGKRCSQTRYLDVDHIHPLALGGLTELKNLQILCRAHNGWKGIRLDTYHNHKLTVGLEPVSPVKKSLRDRLNDRPADKQSDEDLVRQLE